MTPTLADELRAACSSFKTNEPLSKHTSLAIGGPAEYYVEVVHAGRTDGAAESRPKTSSVFPFFLGAGSNLLVSDKGI